MSDLSLWSKWYLVSGRIRRYRRVSGETKWQSYPSKSYKHLKVEADLEAFVTRLNGEHEAARKKAEAAYEFKHKFITAELLANWEENVRATMTKEVSANDHIKMVKICFLNFFINQLKLSDPMDWHKHQLQWGQALMSKDKKHKLYKDGKPRSKRRIDDIVWASNRFMRFIHKANPGLFPLIEFEPISKPVLADYEARRRLDNRETRIGKFVPDKDWTVIEKKLSPRVRPFVQLAYYLGLRRAETLGVQLEDVYEDYFHLQRQLEAIPETGPKYGPPKNDKPRHVPYWFTTPDDIYYLIESLPPRMHPDTLLDKVGQEMKDLGFDYTMHDFRRTFITRALRKGISHWLVMEAVGHADVETTKRYVMDEKDEDRKPYVPKRTKLKQV